MWSPIRRFRRRQYIGKNRCWPCTIINSLLLAVACGALALVSIPAAAVAAAVGSGVIALRGYLLPYTPRFAPRIALWLPRDPFGLSATHRDGPVATSPNDDHPDGLAIGGSGVDERDEDAVLEQLYSAGVLVAHEEQLFLADEFRERWRSEMSALRALSDTDIADASLDASPQATEADVVRDGDRVWIVLSDGSGDVSAEPWLSRPVAIAETAAVRALSEIDVTPDVRSVAAHSLGLFLARCPACDTAIEETTEAACCGGPDRSPTAEPRDVLACPNCDQQLYLL